MTPFAKLDVDWEKTKVWSEGGYYARVFFNVKGREPQGVIEPADYESFRDEIKAKFEATADREGKPLGTLVFKPEQIYHAVQNVAPDLIVHFGGLYWRSIGGVGYPTIHVLENDTGPDDCNHAQFGAFILAASNSPLQGEITGARLLDIAPTLLELAGYEIPASMQGRSLVAGQTPAPGQRRLRARRRNDHPRPPERAGIHRLNEASPETSAFTSSSWRDARRKPSAIRQIHVKPSRRYSLRPGLTIEYIDSCQNQVHCSFDQHQQSRTGSWSFVRVSRLPRLSGKGAMRLRSFQAAGAGWGAGALSAPLGPRLVRPAPPGPAAADLVGSRSDPSRRLYGLDELIVAGTSSVSARRLGSIRRDRSMPARRVPCSGLSCSRRVPLPVSTASQGPDGPDQWGTPAHARRSSTLISSGHGRSMKMPRTP